MSSQQNIRNMENSGEENEKFLVPPPVKDRDLPESEISIESEEAEVYKKFSILSSHSIGLHIFMFIAILSIFNNVLLVLSLRTSSKFETLKCSCPESVNLLIFLDFIFSLFVILFSLSTLEAMRGFSLKSGPFPSNYNSIFAGMFIFWAGFKAVLLLLFIRNNDCLFVDLWDLPLEFTPKLHPAFVWGFYMLQAILLIFISWTSNKRLTTEQESNF